MIIIIAFDSRKVREADKFLLLPAIKILCTGKQPLDLVMPLRKLLTDTDDARYPSIMSTKTNDFIRNQIPKLLVALAPITTNPIKVSAKAEWSYAPKGADTVITVGNDDKEITLV